METRLRHRVIGALVLGAIALIFLPLLFKESNPTPPHARPVMVTEQIPASPPKPAAQAQIVVQNAETASEPASSTTQTLVQTISTEPEQNNVNSTRQNESGFSQENTPELDSRLERIDAANQTIITSQTLNFEKKTATPKKQASAESKKKATIPIAINDDDDNDKTLSHNKTSAKKSKTKAQLASNKETVSTKPHAPPAIAWIIQLGSFTDAANAKALETRLQQKGFSAYHQKLNTKKGVMTRILVGPETQYDKAKEILSRLTKEHHIKGGVILPYEFRQAR